MAASVLQSAAMASLGAQLTYTATFGSLPTSGNVLVAIVNSDATVSTPAGFTVRQTVVSGTGFYVFEKISNGTELSIVTTPTSSARGGMIIMELAGVTTFDVAPTPVQTAATGTSVSCASLTTTAANDLVFAIGGFGGFVTVPTGITYNNSFTALTTSISLGSSGNSAGCFIGQKIQAAAGAVGATTASWTNTSAARTGVHLSYKASIGPAPSGTSSTLLMMGV